MSRVRKDADEISTPDAAVGLLPAMLEARNISFDNRAVRRVVFPIVLHDFGHPPGGAWTRYIVGCLC